MSQQQEMLPPMHCTDNVKRDLLNLIKFGIILTLLAGIWDGLRWVF